MTSGFFHPLIKLQGIFNLEGDKSLTHRYLFFASLAEKPVKIRNISTGLDVNATIDNLRRIGVRIDILKANAVVVYPFEKSSLNKKDRLILDCRNSGTTCRLLLGFMAAFGIEGTITGDESLSRRPMRRVTTPLRLMGAVLSENDTGSLPVHVTGTIERLNGIEYMLESPSAQVKTAIILAGLKAKGETILNENLKTRDHTELMLRSAGADIDIKEGKIFLKPLQKPLDFPDEIVVPGDISTAAFYAAGASILPGSDITIRNLLLNEHRARYLHILKDAGALIDFTNCSTGFSEEAGDVRIRYGGRLQPISIDGYDSVRCVDEVPILSVAAATARGKSTFRDLSELRFKESDRIESIVRNLSILGVNIVEREDGMDITESVLRGGKVESYGDHRIAMAMKIAGLISKEPVICSGSKDAAVSAPGFYKILDSLVKVRSRDVIFLTGFMGAGKTSVGELLSCELDYCFYDTDDMVREKAGMSISDIFRNRGESEFRRIEKEILFSLDGLEKCVIATGGGIPCDKDNISFIFNRGIVIYLKAQVDILLDRVRREKGRPLLKDRVSFHDLWSLRSNIYDDADLIINTELLKPVEVVRIIKNSLLK